MEERATARADSLAKRLIARTDSAFGTIEVLSAREKSRLRRYLQDEHLARARRLGLDPLQDRRAVARLMAQSENAVRLQTNDFYIIDPEMSYAVPLVVPPAAHLLGRIGHRFQQDMQAKALPPYRFIITNVLRTGIDQTHLRGENANAAQGQSTHEYGTSFDIFYGRFHYAASNDSLARSAARSGRINRAHLRERLREAYLRFGKKRARKIKAVLGRTLLRMQEEGLLVAIYERQQDVFHLTAAREVNAPATAEEEQDATVRRQRLYANTESLLADIANDIEELREQAKNASGDARQSLQNDIAALQDERDQLQKELTRLDGASSSQVSDARSGLLQNRTALVGNVERARIGAMQRSSEVREHVRTRIQEMERAITQLEGLVEYAEVGSKRRQQVTDLRTRLGKLERQLGALSGGDFQQKRSDLADAVARLSANLQTVSENVTEAALQS